MKKIIATLVAVVFLVGFTFAQNTDTTFQTGNSNLAKTTQTGINHSEAVQFGNSNTATLSQDGSKNYSSINQGMTKGYWSGYQTNGASYNQATLTQTGNWNQGYLEQYGGSSKTNGNEASLTQYGNGNFGYGAQGWAYSGWGETYTTSHLQSYNSTVNISQVGNNNWVGAWQYGGNNNKISISENGSSNLAEIAQGEIYSDYHYTFTHPVYNTKNNNASITQSGNNNHGKLFQLGDNNYFKLSQAKGSSVGYSASTSGLGESRDAYFQQDGNNNQFNGLQTDGATLDAVSEGISGYYGSFQKGNGNTISLNQNNDNALMQQLGDSNTETLLQGGTAVNNATMLQNGNSNTASLVQQ